jgi:uncharacterized protein (TIGR00299 family) protein
MKKVGYFEVFDGCAGDMLAGSLIDAGLDIELLKKELMKLPLKNYQIQTKKIKRKTHFGHFIEGTQFSVIPVGKWNDKTSYNEICKIIEKSLFHPDIKEKIIKIFDILAEGESRVHSEEKKKLHFHEVGQIDAIIEIATVVIGIELLEIKKVFSSSVGISKIAPATIEILKGVPTIIKNVPYEITTPTGASIIKGISNFSSELSDFFINKVGYGAGTREDPSPNMVKFLIGEKKDERESVVFIETNIDDMNPVLIGHLVEKLYKDGAFDVSVFCGIGKKNRPVFKIEIIVPEEKFQKISKILFEESTTLGFRYRKENRVILERKIKEIETEFGKIKVKFSYLDGKLINISPEYEDCKKISEGKQIPLKIVYQKVFKKLENNLNSC